MNTKNMFTKTAIATSLVGILCSCTNKLPNDTSYAPYTPIAIDSIKVQKTGSRVMVQGSIRSVENEMFIIECGSSLASIVRNDYCTSAAAGDVTNTNDNLEWDSIAPILRKNVVSPTDTNTIYSKNIKVYGVVNDGKMLEMRFFEINNTLYEAFK